MSQQDPTGHMLIAGDAVTGSGTAFRAIDPTTDEYLDPLFAHGGAEDVDRACAFAEDAFATYRTLDRTTRAAFLEAIADNIEAIGEPLLDRARAETGLPQGRLSGERGRTTGQLRMFAALLRGGDEQIPRIDPARPDRKPPRADIRQRSVPLGPVAVFGASNFPLAFSVAGGDVASALAAGCPVVVKAHDAHPGTSELVARAVTEAVADLGLPAGTFSMLFGSGPGLGVQLVGDRRIRAVGFTGSRAAGLALVAAARARTQPIPVYAEMSSINPVCLLPGALGERPAELARGFVGSLTSGAGQFCTNPGLVLAVDGPQLRTFLDTAASDVAGSEPGTMLTRDIARSYAEGVAELAAHPATEVIARGSENTSANECRPVLLAARASDFLADSGLHREVFGASSLVVRCRDTAELRKVVDNLEGQLTATVHASADDHGEAARLLPILELRAGRILFDGWPTGVEVGHAMLHGGPFPATSDSRTTSVGTAAIERFQRPVAYQDVPAELLPAAIAAGNPEGLLRRIDGEPGRH